MGLEIIVLVTLLAVVVAAGPAASAAFYVAPDGSDTNPGTKVKPFASLERARDAIRALKQAGPLPDGGVTVWIRGGVYCLEKTFQLTAEDSGVETSPVVYRAYEGEEVRLIGGREVTGFKPVSDPAILSRLDDVYRCKVLQTDLKAQGITDFGEMTQCGFGRAPRPTGLELFFNGKPMTLARWPNDAWAKIADVPADQEGGKFTYEGDRPNRWAQADDIWVHGYWTWDWADSYEKVKSINTETREVETVEPHGAYGYKAGRRYYALNILEELDAPGEWYLDRKTGILYFWPPSDIHKGKAFVSILSDPIVSLQDASYVTLCGLTLEYTRGDAVWVIGGTHNLIADCTLRNVGGAAVSIKGGDENGVVGCEISETGGCGVALDGGDRKTLTPGGNYVENNHIHDFSRWVRTYQPAILISGVGNRIAHNLIHDAPHSAIILHGNEHIIEFNEIHHVCTETGDAGAFYIGRDWSQRGNIVRFNYFHHLSSAEGMHGFTDVMAVYLDDWTSGTKVFGNVFYKAGRAVLIGGGRDNTIQNNILVDCNPAIHVDARGLGWAKSYFDGRTTTLFDRLEAVNYKELPYSERYPELLTLLNDEPAVPKNNSIVRNICLGGKWLDIRDSDKFDQSILDIRDNLTEGGPDFVDPANEDFQPKDDSPAWKLGFKRIPIEQIGLRSSPPSALLP